MNNINFNRSNPAGNPIANIFVIIVGALAIGVSIVVGFFAFLVLGGIVLVLGSIISLRIWWLSRKLKQQPDMASSQKPTENGGVIEGEYHVVKGDEKP